MGFFILALDLGVKCFETSLLRSVQKINLYLLPDSHAILILLYSQNTLPQDK